MRIAHDLVALLSFRIYFSWMEICVLGTINLPEPNDCCFPVSIHWNMSNLPETTEGKFYFIFNLGGFPRGLFVAVYRQIFDVYGILPVFDLSWRQFWHVNERLFFVSNFGRLNWIGLTFGQEQILEIHLGALSTLNLHLVLGLYGLLLQPIFDLEQLQLAVLYLLNLNGRIYFLRFIQLSGLLQLAEQTSSALKLSQLLIYLLPG